MHLSILCILILAKIFYIILLHVKSNSPPWVFFTFLKLYKWYRIAQRITCFQNKNQVTRVTSVDRIIDLRQIRQYTNWLSEFTELFSTVFQWCFNLTNTLNSKIKANQFQGALIKVVRKTVQVLLDNRKHQTSYIFFHEEPATFTLSFFIAQTIVLPCTSLLHLHQEFFNLQRR